MKLFNCLLAMTFSAGIGLAMLSATPAIAAPAQQYPAAAPDYGYGPNGPHPALRSLIDRTQNDLRMAQQLEPRSNEDVNERYKHAQGHLSTFDRKLVRGHFDNGELKDAVKNIKDILDKNVLQVSSRNALSYDLGQLQMVRARH
jgi:hypothetical protein